MSKKATTLAKIRALLEDAKGEVSSHLSEDQVREAKISFYQQFWGFPLVNEGTIGLEVQHDVAEAVIDGDENTTRKEGESAVEEAKTATKSHKSKKRKSKSNTQEEAFLFAYSADSTRYFRF
ncbi:hypothetical protein L915_03279 [Phytophthora nicotianae]|uniref:Uncharacterized protein n=1 Tax=Phytophthora nicotianae TaxID=4792 RepID=W2HEA6_PHYNI|nr:hypothetical protein L915_03279 [Phytophthora nicotianae]